MAAKKKTIKSSTIASEVPSTVKSLVSSNFNIRRSIAKAIALNNLSSLLSVIFYVVWIPVGIFFIWFIFANFKAGAFEQLMNASTQQPPEISADPTETTVPGVGKVNIQCVQAALPEESIIKIVQEKGTGSLTEEEKQKLEPCIIEKAAETSPEG